MILHGIFLCITSFIAGMILTWLFFAWKMDKEESALCKRINYLEIDNRALRNEGDVLTKVAAHCIKAYAPAPQEWCADVLYDLARNPKIGQNIDIEIRKQQEKESGNSKD